MIIGSMASNTLSEETLRQTMEVIIGSLGYFVIGAFVALGLTKLMRCPKDDQGVLMVIITAVNTGFMGFPVTKSIFGDDMFFLMVIQNQILTVYLYFISVIQMNYGHKKSGSLKDIIKPLCNMCTLAAIIGFIIFFGGIQLPEIVTDFFNTIGDATIPISMIVVRHTAWQQQSEKNHQKRASDPGVHLECNGHAVSDFFGRQLAAADQPR